MVQEIALAKCNICLFEQYEIQLEHILMSAKWLEHNYIFLDERLSSCAGWLNASTMSHYTTSPHSIYGSGFFKPNILAILNNISRTLSCEDPRDKIYAILGLLDWSEHGGLPPELAPDYSRNPAEVLTLAASWAIRSNQWKVTDNLLSGISHRSSEDIHLDGLPSWVPRWHRTWQSDLDPSPLRTRDARNFVESPSSVEQSIADVAASSRWIVKGSMTDVMQEVAPTREIWSWHNFAEDYVKPLQHFLDLSGKGMDRDVSGVILSADTWLGFNPLSGNGRQKLAQWLNEGLSNAAEFSRISDSLEGCDNAIATACTGQYDPCVAIPSGDCCISGPVVSYQHFFTARVIMKTLLIWLPLLLGRSVALTKSGLPCLVPRITTAGDIVVWISGSDYPTILRPCEYNYEVIGKAYVHGIMDGEAIESWKARGGEVETFSLI